MLCVWINDLQQSVTANLKELHKKYKTWDSHVVDFAIKN
jgi:hypothetical protein